MFTKQTVESDLGDSSRLRIISAPESDQPDQLHLFLDGLQEDVEVQVHTYCGSFFDLVESFVRKVLNFFSLK